MSEPEDVLLDGAHLASGFVAALWQRRRAGPATLELVDIRTRLELLIAALFADPPGIVVAQAPARPTPMARWVRRIPRHMLEERALSSTDGFRLRLPSSLDATDGRDDAIALYRLLAIQQAYRAERGTPDLLPSIDDPLVRDLYWLAEAAVVDMRIARELPGWVGDLARARERTLLQRTVVSGLTPPERKVEALLREVLGGSLQSPQSPPPALEWAGERTVAPSESLAWAERFAEELRDPDARYRGIPAVPLWGVPEEPGSEPSERVSIPGGGPSEERQPAQKRVGSMSRRPKVREELEDEDDESSGMWAVQLDDPQEHVEDPMGLQRPTDRDDQADSDDLADSLSELPEARLVAVPGTPTELLVSPDPPDRRATWQDPEASGIGIAYPEWDWREEAYRPGYAVVRIGPAPEGEAEWSQAILKRRASEVRRIRHTFERLRPRRVRLGRQRDGPDLDLSAWVSAWTTARAGGPFDDRLYENVRPSRRALAISLLIDVSGSTDSWVAGTQRIIDVEKEALLLVCEGLDALGDRYNVLAFSGEGPRGVSVTTVKSFDDSDRSMVRRRIAALNPDQYTRLGAAIRHATTLLDQEAAEHRLLLVLSDGKPNDVDQYEGRYGIEDARQAVAEARLQGMHPYCLTIDRHAPAYLPRLFGPGGFAMLHDAARLPGVLVEVVQKLIRS